MSITTISIRNDPLRSACLKTDYAVTTVNLKKQLSMDHWSGIQTEQGEIITNVGELGFKTGERRHPQMTQHSDRSAHLWIKTWPALAEFLRSNYLHPR